MDTLPDGQSSKSPAFSFYAKEFLAATLAWALDARGAYVTLLAYQWDAGSVPANDMSSLGRVLGISSTKARLVWAIISDKFERGADGQWRNLRLEQEREKQRVRREALRANGVKGGRPPNNQTLNQNETNRFSETEPNRNLNESLSSSSSFSGSAIPPVAPQGGRSQKRARGLRDFPKADPRAVEQAQETRTRRAEMTAQGLSESDIEAVLDREYEERRNA